MYVITVVILYHGGFLVIIIYYMRRGCMGRIIGFIIWLICSLIFVFIGIAALRAKEPVGFFAQSEPPKVKDVKAYNRAVAKIWFFFATGMFIIGLPLIFAKQNSPLFIIPILGAMFLSIAICVMYISVEKKYKE